MPNLFDIVAPAAAERFDTLLARPGVRIERIVSAGHVSPPGCWYDQGGDEWVAVVEGAAMVEFAGMASVGAASSITPRAREIGMAKP